MFYNSVLDILEDPEIIFNISIVSSDSKSLVKLDLQHQVSEGIITSDFVKSEVMIPSEPHDFVPLALSFGDFL